MRQWQIQPDNTLSLATASKPSCAPEEVQIQIKALGVNRADLLQVKGLYPAPKGFDSTVPGLEYAGIVSQVGERVLTRKVGDHVMGLIPSAAYSDYLCVHELETLTLPDSLSFEQAATIPEAFLTSYRALCLEAQLQAGQTCLIRPASAGVGLAAVQLALALGAKVFGSSRTLTHLNQAQKVGLNLALTENQELGQALLTHTNGQGVDVIMDMIGPNWNDLLTGLSIEGTLVLVGVMAGTHTQLDLFTLLTRRQKIHAMTMRAQPLDERIKMARIFNQRLAPLFATDKLKPLPFVSFDFTLAPQAHHHMQHNHFAGKRVLVL